MLPKEEIEKIRTLRIQGHLENCINNQLYGNGSCICGREIKKLDLGSGYRKREGFISIDNRNETNPDILLDATEGLPFKTSSIDYIRAVDFLEHIPIGKVVPLIEEIWRVLVPGGNFFSMTPSTSGYGAFQDPFHVSFWNNNSWLYYTVDVYRNLYSIRAKFSGDVYEKIIDSRLNIFYVFAELVAVK